MRTTMRFSSLLAVTAIVAAAVGWSIRAAVFPATPTTASSPGASASDTPPGAPMRTDLFRTIARQENPSVVAIMTTSRVKASPDESSQLFQWFFGQQPPRESRVQRGLGSGFLVSSDGEILTNNHVVADADVIQVSLFGDERRTYRADVIGRDPISDSALIRLQQPPVNLRVATLGDSDALEPGDWVMAIGNPFQLGHTVTVGVVSYQGRPFEVEEGHWERMIQTDASINPGNSGGPLINVQGEVVGINAAILDPGTNGNIGIGFAVPINTIKSLLPQLEKGRVVRGRIGVQLRGGPISDDEAKALGLPKAAGAIVTAVERDSPADRAGLQAGDVIVAFNGTPATTADDLVPRVSSAAPGSRIRLTIIRDGDERTVDVTVEELTTDGQGGNGRPQGTMRNFGLTLRDVTPSVAQELRLPSGVNGAVVIDVASDSPADQAGFQQADVVRRINNRAVRIAADAERVLESIQPGNPAFFIVWRDGNAILVQLQKQ
jgi:serine protease Do